MSLIVANKAADHIYFVGDTKVTHRYSDDRSLTTGVVKCVILSESLCVACAGNMELAEDSLREIGTEDDSKAALRILERLHDTHPLEVEFLVGSLQPTSTLWLVKNGKTAEVNTGWIGSQDGFNEYQSIFLGNATMESVARGTATWRVLKLPDDGDDDARTLFSQMFGGLAGVIEGGKCEAISGFVVPVITEGGRFKYGTYFDLFRKPIDVECEVPADGTPATIMFGDAPEGTVTVNFTGCSDAIAVHIQQAKLGIVFRRQGGGQLHPECYSNTDEIDFATILQAELGEELAFSIAHGLTHFCMKADVARRRTNFPQAVDLFTKGIEVASKSWGEPQDKSVSCGSLSEFLAGNGCARVPINDIPHLKMALYLRGLCFVNLSKLESALTDFREAFTLDPRWYDAQLAIIKTLATLQRPADALEIAHDCCTRHPKAESFQVYGELLRIMGESVNWYGSAAGP